MKIVRPLFYEGIRKQFGKLDQPLVDNYERLLNNLESEDMPLTHAAYLLATTWHETAFTMEPILERGSRDYIAAHYDPILASTPARRESAKRMGNQVEGDGWKYRGRGYVQLTWKANYQRMGEEIGVDLVAHPDLAIDPDIAYQILSIGMRNGLFTGSKMADHLNTHKTDYIGARRVVNGLDCAMKIATYAMKYQKCLGAAE